jgi:hypothetical protein
MISSPSVRPLSGPLLNVRQFFDKSIAKPVGSNTGCLSRRVASFWIAPTPTPKLEDHAAISSMLRHYGSLFRSLRHRTDSSLEPHAFLSVARDIGFL